MYDFLISPFEYEYMQIALLVGIIVAVACALLSCLLNQLGWSLIGDGVSHAVLPGVVLAYILGLPFVVGALVFALLAVGLIGGVRRAGTVRDDAAIGIVFTTLFSFGLVLITWTPSSVDLGHILFGNLLGASNQDVIQVSVLAVIVIVALAWRWRDFLLLAVDPSHAHAIGLNVGRLTAAVLVLLALTTVAGMQAAGVILVVALLIIPGAAAAQLTWSFGHMMLWAALLSSLATVMGILCAYHFNSSLGGMIVICQSAIFVICLLAGKRGVIRR
ncbi:metal ABC transporter permease [Dermabacteraceae bacterium P7074]